MIHVKFKSIKKSEIAIEAAQERIGSLVEKFPDLSESKIQVTLEMQNSPFQAGPDLFKVKVHVLGGRYGGITVEKSDSNLYVALAEVVDHMLEVLNRYGDRVRVRQRKQARKLNKTFEVAEDIDEKRTG